MYRRTTHGLPSSRRNRMRRQYRSGILETVIVIVRRDGQIKPPTNRTVVRPQNNSINLCR